ncbi:MAG TPA: RNA-guided pseudouridylation complex pseudouridine synthase subunit Cbf5 [Nitrosopumilaceae archaeon]|nr:RNA-guided pseudouridylation complex pseudouridine synthase subunit Cbf5 [Nitrosopumilaceae archaeon]
MVLKQLQNLRVIDQDITNDSYGTYCEKRTVQQLLDYGFILLDKPNGPTSHETVAWIKKILNIPKAGHSGTLDPMVSGILPVGLGEATKALIVLLLGPKEYHALGRLHTLPSNGKLQSVLKQFTGKIYQKPPQRSSVSRQTRVRSVYEIDVIEQKERLILMRILCEAGTYIRKIFYDIGEVLGPGATMIELRRTRVSQFNEDSNLVKMHDLVDAYAMWKEKNDDSKLRRILMPIEYVLSELKSVVIRDSAVDALCHGAQLAIPGILEISHGITKGDFVGIYTQKGEVVALAEAILSESEIVENTKGFAFQLRRIIMAPNTYPKNWRTKPVINN